MVRNEGRTDDAVTADDPAVPGSPGTPSVAGSVSTRPGPPSDPLPAVPGAPPHPGKDELGPHRPGPRAPATTELELKVFPLSTIGGTSVM